MTDQENDRLAASIVAALDLEGMGRKARSVREIAALVGGGVALVASITIAAVEVQSKPDSPEVESMIREGSEMDREKAAIVEDRVNRVEVAVEDFSAVKKDVERIEDVQGYLIDASAWQGDILEHIAGGNRGRVPKKPETLKAKERELLRK
tara:strand:+ start:365 stop:817 length:453 start_codon:yes stop_codon:yes gene_type:complete